MSFSASTSLVQGFAHVFLLASTRHGFWTIAKRIFQRFICLCLFSALAACSLAPRYQRPEQDLPKEWRSVDLGAAPLDADWWTRFQDPVLTALIDDALAQNQDIAESLARLDSAAAKVGVATAALFPQASGTGAAQAQGASEKGPNAVPFSKSGMSRWTTQYQGALSAGWELDLWGKVRNQRTMLSDVLMNSVIGHEGLRLSVAAQTAQGYFALLALDMQLETAKRTFKSRKEAFGIYTSRYRQGDITELDWQRARAEVETARAQVHTSTVAVDQAEAALAVLIGRAPRDIINQAMPRGQEIGKLPAPPVLPSGLPSELLMRRPDIRAAEYLIMAYNANIGVARAQFFPSISLTGMLGTLSASVANLFTGPAATWSYGATGSIPLLDFGNNWYNLKDAEAQKRAAEAAYRKSVQTAFQDVRTSLTAQREAGAIVESMQIEVESLRRATEIARLQYNNGYTDYLTVLDAERQLFAAELQLASALRDRLNAVVGVCMALGGGWSDSGAKPAFPIVDAEKLLQEEKAVGRTGETGIVQP